jgi:GT2 family glycosyltransferase
MKNKKTSVILVTYNRPKLALQAVTTLYETTKHLNVELILVVDGDIKTVHNVENFLKDKVKDTWNYIMDYSPQRRGALWSWNYGLSLTTGDMLFPSGDDQFFHPGWLDKALECHEKELGGYGMVTLNDRIWDGNILGVAPFYDRKFCIDYLGGVCTYPAYNYFYVDNELNERAKLAGRYVWCPESVVEHIHPSQGKRPRDIIDQERDAQNFGSLDKMIFERRKAAGFPNDFEPAIK